jgi:hypothetical protein
VGDECPDSLERFEGEKVKPEPLPYVLGMDVTIDGLYGSIQTVEGFDGEVSVVFSPFNYRMPDEELEAQEELESGLDYTFRSVGNAIEVATDRLDATDGLGADITVRLPPEFEGALVVRNRGDGAVYPGGIAATYVGLASSVDFVTDGRGDCFASSQGSVYSSRARCEGRIMLLGVSDELDVASTGLGGDVVVFLKSVAGQGAGGTITSEDGNIELGFPDGSSFSVQAELASSGLINAEFVESDECVIEADSPKSKRLTCGESGPDYVATAGTREAGRSDISIYRTP